jgi:hypothetical protein
MAFWFVVALHLVGDSVGSYFGGEKGVELH